MGRVPQAKEPEEKVQLDPLGGPPLFDDPQISLDYIPNNDEIGDEEALLKDKAEDKVNMEEIHQFWNELKLYYEEHKIDRS